MARNAAFHPEREPLKNDTSLRLDNRKIHGPVTFLNPTQARYDHATASNVGFNWTSRNNRKGRHALVVKPPGAASAQYTTPPPSNTAKEVLKGIWRMFWYYPIWDVSYLVAVVFTWGSVIWVINAFFAFLPFTNPSTSFPTETLYGGGITAFIGATVFEIGSVLLMLEAVNENRTGCFGWALEEVYEDHLSRVKPDNCTHHHPNKGNLNPTVSTDGTPPGAKSWVWWPSWHELRTHYLHDLGFIACSWQMFGATVFWISGFTALPGIFNHLSPISVLNGVYWVPQVVGGTGFVISGTLFMLETQKHWWQPAFGVLGWHIGFWNLVGGIGFTLCPIFGFGTSYWREYQASCSTFWGSWAFLVGSAIQWYESLDKNPVEKANG
ncbi:hypothetical protein BAUCODRAFT_77390 [Baudoinia panamericana UAMH 10762]|uniref:Integral membrane protein n=1 Tax=Baudoinia panamericana (strain UAMH 10762) TaxID=717646 RepID=M2LG04_BAUPA|nr:uncharacterized protein BAUCODRAFT_77390 [Baudoinia panamericana UAMH 10762]EMC92962.1 hypothetical protein BAUCODRAFT_77390 [Baudoinia panamericana UAMH 10762]